MSSHARTTVPGDVPATPAAALAERAPFRRPADEHGSARARITGVLPSWLHGTLIRTAPTLAPTSSWSATHWFDGIGLLYALRLGAGGVSLRWALLDCAMVRAAKGGAVRLAHFGTRNQRGLWRTLFGPIPETTDNANVNVIAMGDDVVALTETPHQLVVDPETLAVRARVVYRDALGTAALMLAHPIVVDGTLVNLATGTGPTATISLYAHPAASRERRVLARWKTTKLPYLHSFGLTERAGIVVAHPFTTRPTRLLWSNRGFIEHFAWHPEQGTKLVVMDRTTGAAREHETEAFFTFHTVHAFETDDATVLDLLAYDDASIVSALSTASMVARAPDLRPSLLRFSIDRRSGRVKRERLADQGFEFPQVDWKRAGTGPERAVFGAALSEEGGRMVSEVVRIDLVRGDARKLREAGWVFGEPVFVASPDGRAEGDGVLLSVGSSAERAALLVLDAATLDVLARADLDVPLPLGFHGSFLPGR
jgi:beta,beta-carotene 9',10'-dioxygenase